MERHGNVRNHSSRQSPPGLLAFGSTNSKDQEEFLHYLYLQFKFWKKERSRIAYRIRRSLKSSSFAPTLSVGWTHSSTSHISTQLSVPTFYSLEPDIHKIRITSNSSFTSSISSFSSSARSSPQFSVSTLEVRTARILRRKHFTSKLTSHQVCCIVSPRRTPYTETSRFKHSSTQPTSRVHHPSRSSRASSTTKPPIQPPTRPPSYRAAILNRPNSKDPSTTPSKNSSPSVSSSMPSSTPVDPWIQMVSNFKNYDLDYFTKVEDAPSRGPGRRDRRKRK